MTLAFKLSFWEQYRASLWVFHRSVAAILSYVFFGGGSLLGLLVHVSTDRALSLVDWVVLAAGLFFLPLLLLILLGMRQLRAASRASARSFSFGEDEVIVRTPHIDTRLRWDAFLRARESGEFLFLFLSSSGAIAVPRRVASENGCLDEVRQLVQRKLGARALLRTDSNP